MRHLLLRTIAIVSFVFLAACQTESQDLVNPPREYSSAAAEGTTPNLEVNPKVDILFVIDDSASMQPHQQRLVENINYFLESFSKYDLIDFHIGAVTVWDSIRYQSKSNPKGKVPALSSDGFRNFYQKGQLQPLQTPAGQESLLELFEGKNFVYRTPNAEDYLSVLRSTLNIIPKCHESYSTCKPPAGEGRGPEFEELFSPVISALTSSSLLKEENQDFRRPDAQLVLIFITDADDASPDLSASEFTTQLRLLTNSKQEQNFSVYGVIHPPDRADSKECPKDPSGKATKLKQFFDLTQAQTLDICSQDYGTVLSSIGEKIRREALAGIIYLPYKPEYRIVAKKVKSKNSKGKTEIRYVEELQWIEVFYGSQKIPNDPEIGWTYDEERNVVIIHEGVELKPEPDAKLIIHYTPVNFNTQGSGQTQAFH